MINKLIQILDPHTKEVLQKSSSSLLVKVLGMLFGLLVSILLGRTLGADGLGIINLANQIVLLTLSFTLLGFPNLLIKNISIAYQEKKYDEISSNMSTSFFINGGLSLFVIILLILFSKILTENIFKEPRLFYPLIIALIAMFPQVISRIYSSGLIGYKKIWQSNLVDQTLSMGFIAISLSVLWLVGIEINLINVALIFGTSRFVVATTVGLYWKVSTKNPIIPNIRPSLIKKAIPFFWVTLTGMSIDKIDTIMLGWLSDSTDVGLYSVALRIALLTSFFLQITNSTIAPKTASLFAQKKFNELEKMVKRITAGLSIIGIIPFAIYYVWGREILSIWGSEFENAYYILIVLSIGQFFNIATGSVSTILNMCGYERLHSLISLFFLVISLALFFIAIQLWGVFGLAISLSIITILKNFTKVIVIKKYIGFWTIPLP